MFNQFAVIGNPISHSLSPFIHQSFALQVGLNLSYEKILGDEISFEKLVVAFFEKGKGLNVTMPFKQKAFALAQQSSYRCQQAKSANTLWIENNQLHADNTDGIGLVRDLSLHLELAHKKILILGAGGAARGIIHPLLSMKPADLAVARRSKDPGKMLLNDFPEIKQVNFEEISPEYDLIINATSASLEGQSIQLPKLLMDKKPFCYDLVYLPKGTTPFVSYARNFNCQAADGIGMLVEQAAEAFFIWNGIMPDTSMVLKKLHNRSY